MANSKLVKFKDKKGNTYPYLYIDEMTGEFYVIKRIGDEIRKRPLGKEFVKARSMILTVIQEMTGEQKTDKGNKLVKDFYEILMEEKDVLGVKESTKKAIRSVWSNRIAPYWEHLTKEEINPAQVTKFMTWHKRTLPGVQFFNTFKYLGNIFSVMVEHGEMALHEIPKLTIPLDEQKHHDKPKGRYVSPNQIKEILSKTETDEEYIFISVDYALGFRKTEWAEITKDKVVYEGNRYVVKFDIDDTKTGMVREVPLPVHLTERITKQYKSSNSKYLFPMKSDPGRPVYSQLIDKFWTDAKERAGVRGQLRFHDLRHSAATNFAKANVNPIIACTILGMSLAMYQKVYCKLKASDLIIAVEQSATLVGVE